MRAPIFVFVLGLSLGGCSAVSALNGTVSDVAPQAVITAEKVLTAAHALHEAAADGATIAANSNLCISTCATKVRGYIDQSETILLAADAALKAGDTVGVQAKVSAALSIIATIESLTSGAK